MENKTLKKKYKTSNSELEVLKYSAKKSSSLAVKESRVLGLTIKLISKNNLIEKSPTGEIKILRKIVNISSKNGLKKGAVLCRK